MNGEPMKSEAVTSKQVTHYDIPTALRGEHRQPCACVECRAADEIEQMTRERDELTAKVAELRATLEEIGGYDCENYCKHLSPQPCGQCMPCIARKALSGEHPSSETEWSPPQPRPALEGPILPGERFIWEPDNPRAWAIVEVTKIACPRDDERRIYVKTLSGNGPARETWNDESRFREACIRAPLKASGEPT